MRRAARSFPIVGLCVALPGCATLIHGTTESLTITSTPPGATVAVWPTGDTVTAPGEVSLARKGTYSLRYHLDGYDEESVQVSQVDRESLFSWHFEVLRQAMQGVPLEIATAMQSGG